LNGFLQINVFVHNKKKVHLTEGKMVRNQVQMRRFSDSFKIENNYFDTVKPVFNAHPLGPKRVAIVDRWSLFRGRFMIERRPK
jgi:hypothetical protein